jgi:hypothetical protein
MEQRAWMKDDKTENVGVSIVGRSQLGRMKDEIETMVNSGLKVEKLVRMRGELTVEEVDEALAELVVMGASPSVVRGPGNLLVIRRKGECRGFKPERTVKVRRLEGKRGNERYKRSGIIWKARGKSP